MAMLKLANVPIRTYSVVRISPALFNSPNLKMDFAANRRKAQPLYPPALLPLESLSGYNVKSART
ncbi:hypothetical protein [Bacteroides ihuae]|uniref:hypothetical protein n=1 Tax=Bacteroides ihuae TaxID=1852362 RepID=UPI0008DAC0D6|nr:hypothetical protein [Bacteroides ihuae]